MKSNISAGTSEHESSAVYAANNMMLAVTKGDIEKFILYGMSKKCWQYQENMGKFLSNRSRVSPRQSVTFGLRPWIVWAHGAGSTKETQRNLISNIRVSHR